jgi:hypothetical protein
MELGRDHPRAERFYPQALALQFLVERLQQRDNVG